MTTCIPGMRPKLDSVKQFEGDNLCEILSFCYPLFPFFMFPWGFVAYIAQLFQGSCIFASCIQMLRDTQLNPRNSN